MVLGGGVYLLYVCPARWVCPTKPRFWLRCTKEVNNNQPNCTDQAGKWHCSAAGCLRKWEWRSAGDKRVLLIPKNTDADDEEFSDLKMYVIGDCTPEQEHTITLLKSAQLMIEANINGRAVALGKRALIDALDRLGEKAQSKILQSSLPVRRVRAAGIEELKKSGLFAYCENPSLSLAHPGVVYNALQASADTPTIQDVGRQTLLDALVCFYDFSHNKPKNTGPLMDAWRKALETQDEKRMIFWDA